MLDIKLIRNNPEILEKALKSRGIDFSLQELLNLDLEVRKYQTESQNLSSVRNKLSKDIGVLKAQKQDATALMEQVSSTKATEDALVSKTKELEDKIKNILASIPNIPNVDVPVGDETHNKEVKKYGEIKSLNFQPKEHFELGENLKMMDFNKATAMSGSRFVILKSELAQLERALANFMLDVHVQENGYKEHAVPVLLNEEALFNTGQLPKFKEDLFKTTDNKWLISTTEIPLTNIVAGDTINYNDLPLRYTGLSLCFRSEAGSTGRDTKGMLRQHQFYKVELVSISSPEESFNELEYMLLSAEKILQKLEIPYRVMLLSSQDMSFTAAKTYDIEVWLPGQNKYREISSCSNCTDFQARRMNTKILQDNSKNVLVHTLNGSGVAVGRALIAVMENYQQADGSILIPKVLIPYMNGKTSIKLH